MIIITLRDESRGQRRIEVSVPRSLFNEPPALSTYLRGLLDELDNQNDHPAPNDD